MITRKEAKEIVDEFVQLKEKANNLYEKISFLWSGNIQIYRMDKFVDLANALWQKIHVSFSEDGSSRYDKAWFVYDNIEFCCLASKGTEDYEILLKLAENNDEEEN